MADFTIRNIPDALYLQLQGMAKANGRSMNDEVIELMKEAVQMRGLRRQRLSALEEIDRIRTSQPASNQQDTLEIMREGRQR
ncbi:MAG: FitA-like ribbon-helix-helix domain-containing protein [Armatimonadota bacterium]